MLVSGHEKQCIHLALDDCAEMPTRNLLVILSHDPISSVASADPSTALIACAIHFAQQDSVWGSGRRAGVDGGSVVANSEVTPVGTLQKQPQILHCVQDDSAAGERNVRGFGLWEYRRDSSVMAFLRLAGQAPVGKPSRDVRVSRGSSAACLFGPTTPTSRNRKPYRGIRQTGI
jgi:hypothetical protein